MVPEAADFLLVAVYTLSFYSPEASVEQWFVENDAPGKINPLRMTTVFHGVGLQKDELGSSCIGSDFKAELCIQVSVERVCACLRGKSSMIQDGGREVGQEERRGGKGGVEERRREERRGGREEGW